MDVDTGGLGDPRVRGVHPARHPLWHPIIDSVSRSTDLLPGVLDGSRFNGARLWNRSVFVFRVSVQRGWVSEAISIGVYVARSSTW